MNYKKANFNLTKQEALFSPIDLDKTLLEIVEKMTLVL